MRRAPLIRPWVVALAAAAALGCSPRPHAGGRIDLAPARGSRIALLPFDNLTETPEAARRYSQLLFDAVARKGTVELAPPAEVDRILAQQRVRRTDLVDSLTIRRISEELHAAYLLLGVVLDLSEPADALSGSAELTVTVRLIESSTGKTIWTCSDARSGADREGPFGWGVVRSSDRLAEQSTREVAEKFNEFVNHPKSY